MYIIRVTTEESCVNKDSSLKRFNNIRQLASQPGRNYIRSATLYDTSSSEVLADLDNFYSSVTEEA